MVSGGCLWGVLVYMNGIPNNQRCLDMFGGILVLSLCCMEPKHYLGVALNGMTFVHLSILRHQNIKMSIYKVNNKLASLVATLVRNSAHLITDSLTDRGKV